MATSEWATGSGYNEIHYVYDIAQLVNQKRMAPVTIIAHSLGGWKIALLYLGPVSGNREDASSRSRASTPPRHAQAHARDPDPGTRAQLESCRDGKTPDARRANTPRSTTPSPG